MNPERILKLIILVEVIVILLMLILGHGGLGFHLNVN
jgi:hypothetical protein